MQQYPDSSFRREPQLSLGEFGLLIARLSFGDMTSPHDNVCCRGNERYRLGTLIRQTCTRDEYTDLIERLCKWKASNGRELAAPNSPIDDFSWAGEHDLHDHIPLRLLIDTLREVLAPNFVSDGLPPNFLVRVHNLVTAGIRIGQSEPNTPSYAVAHAEAIHDIQGLLGDVKYKPPTEGFGHIPLDSRGFRFVADVIVEDSEGRATSGDPGGLGYLLRSRCTREQYRRLRDMLDRYKCERLQTYCRSVPIKNLRSFVLQGDGIEYDPISRYELAEMLSEVLELPNPLEPRASGGPSDPSRHQGYREVSMTPEELAQALTACIEHDTAERPNACLVSGQGLGDVIRTLCTPRQYRWLYRRLTAARNDDLADATDENVDGFLPFTFSGDQPEDGDFTPVPYRRLTRWLCDIIAPNN